MITEALLLVAGILLAYQARTLNKTPSKHACQCSKKAGD